MRKYSLNEETFKFIIEFEKNVAPSDIYSNARLVESFKNSKFHHLEFETYIPSAINKSIWYAVKRSGNWEIQKKGSYQKRGRVTQTIELTTPLEDNVSVSASKNNFSLSTFDRNEFIMHLSQNLYEVLMLKKEIPDDVLKKYHLSAKGIGDDLYFLTESYFRQKGLFKGKHSMSDFITPNAKKVIETGNISRNLIYEHMIPKNLFIRQISEITLAGTLTKDLIYNILIKYYFVCTVTKEEDHKLPSIKMDDDWDGVNPFYRYEKAGIHFMPNIREKVY